MCVQQARLPGAAPSPSLASSLYASITSQVPGGTFMHRFVIEIPWGMPPSHLFSTNMDLIQSTQSMISQLLISSRTISRCLSIAQLVYSLRVALAAFRWAGPTLPSRASSLDLHTQVARLRPSAFGSPNQYLKRARLACAPSRYLSGARPSLHPTHFRKPPLAVASA